MLEQTLNNMRQAQIILSSEVAVLITTALTQKRFEYEKFGHQSIWNRLLSSKKRYDFVPSRWEDEWILYNRNVVEPSLCHLLDLTEHTAARVIPDITYSEFCQVLLSGQFKVVFLVAHHVQNETDDAIEFADGMTSITTIHQFFRDERQILQKVNLILMVCEAAELSKKLHGQSPLLQSIASASWKVQLHEGLRFAYHWIKQLDGTRTLGEAYAVGIDKFLEGG